MKRFIGNMLLSGAAIVIGIVMYENGSYGSGARDAGIALAVIGGVAGGIVVLKASLPLATWVFGAIAGELGKAARRRDRSRAQDELLRYKRLFDEEILTQEEYETKMKELKQDIL